MRHDTHFAPCYLSELFRQAADVVMPPPKFTSSGDDVAEEDDDAAAAFLQENSDYLPGPLEDERATHKRVVSVAIVTELRARIAAFQALQKEVETEHAQNVQREVLAGREPTCSPRLERLEVGASKPRLSLACRALVLQ